MVGLSGLLTPLPRSALSSGLTRSLNLIFGISGSYRPGWPLPPRVPVFLPFLSLVCSQTTSVSRERSAERSAFLYFRLFSSPLAQPARWLIDSLAGCPLPPESYWPPWVAQRWSHAHRHGVDRSLHPARGRCIGEASNTGPDTPMPSPRGIDSNGPMEDTLQATGPSDTPMIQGDGMEIQNVQLKLKAITWPYYYSPMSLDEKGCGLEMVRGNARDQVTSPGQEHAGNCPA